LLIDKLILNNTASGIRLADNNNLNHIIGNTLMNNTIGVEIHASSHNTFYHNNFIQNKVYQVQILGGVSNRGMMALREIVGATMKAWTLTGTGLATPTYQARWIIIR